MIVILVTTLSLITYIDLNYMKDHKDDIVEIGKNKKNKILVDKEEKMKEITDVDYLGIKILVKVVLKVISFPLV